MKRVLAFLLVLVVIVSAISAKDFLGASISADFGTATYIFDSSTSYSFDIINGSLGLRGGKFFGEEEHFGLIYSVGAGHCFTMKESTYDTDKADDLDWIGNLGLGFGMCFALSEKLDGIVGIVNSVFWQYGDGDTALWYNLAFSATGNYEISHGFGILFGLDVSVLLESSYYYSSEVEPDDDTGVFLTPFIGCGIRF